MTNDVIMKKTTIYRRPMDENLFEEELTIAALSAMGNPLELLSALVDFEMFRPELEDILVSPGHRPGWGGVRVVRPERAKAYS